MKKKKNVSKIFLYPLMQLYYDYTFYSDIIQ